MRNIRCSNARRLRDARCRFERETQTMVSRVTSNYRAARGVPALLPPPTYAPNPPSPPRATYAQPNAHSSTNGRRRRAQPLLSFSSAPLSAPPPFPAPRPLRAAAPPCAHAALRPPASYSSFFF